MTSLTTWRVEVLRLVRTRRLLALASLYAFLGCTGPLLARYAKQIFSQVSSSSTVQITVAEPTPADGILGFYHSAMQVGLVGCVVVAGLAVCLDSRPALSSFYRTRARVPAILLPRLVVTALAAAAAYTLGLLVACYETAALLGAPDVAATVQTWLLGLAYTAFAVALTFAVSGFVRSSLGTVGTTTGVLVLLPIAGEVPGLARYVPSRLTSVPAELYRDLPHQSPLPALLVVLALALAGGAVAMARIAHRQAL